MLRIRLFVIAVSLLLLSSKPAFPQSCECEVSPSREAQYDNLLFLTPEERVPILKLHNPWGIPSKPANATNEFLLVNKEYVINYDADLRVPTWVSYQLKDEHIVSRSRKDCFRRDPRLPANQASFCGDYEEPVFDRGHMVPRADMNRSEAAMINSFILSNIVPQHDQFNQGVWERFENRVRTWAQNKGEIYVITGAVFDQDEDGERDADSDAERMAPHEKVAIPTHFYKILLHLRPNGFILSLAVMLPHDESVEKEDPVSIKDQHLRDHITSINEIEAVTGVDFLADLPNDVEDAVEAFVAPGLWSNN